MSYNQLRKDYLLDRWVVIATERGRRPTDFAKQQKPLQQPTQTSICPMCPGNEHMTPPATLVYLKESKTITKTKDQNDQRHKNWLLRVVPNLYPAFAPPKQQEKRQKSQRKTDNLVPAIGHHEVIIESPKHNGHPADTSAQQLTHVINAYRDRLKELSAKPYVKYVSIFRNHKPEAGASLSHAHSQIIATPTVPRAIEEELFASKQQHKETGKCPFCTIIKQEQKSPRLIHQDKNYTVLAPYASIHPMEFWIMPNKHQTTLLELSQAETETLADTLKTSLGALKQLVNDPPYNYGFHIAPNKDAKSYYHWHLEVYPKLSIWAGFELSTGMYINTITPETAAETMRKTILP